MDYNSKVDNRTESKLHSHTVTKQKKRMMIKMSDETITITRLASFPKKALSGIARLDHRPGRRVSQHAGGRRYA